MRSSHLYRKWTNRMMVSCIAIAPLVALVPLFLILIHLFKQGSGAIDLDFFLHMPRPVGDAGGGMANAIVGTGMLILLACSIGIPVGLLGGLYLSEFGNNRLGDIVRFMADLLNGTPSIVIGIFVYAIVVVPMGGFSALSGGVALGLIMIPIILRTTEEIVRMVPQHLREGSLALGIPYWKTLTHVVLRTARGGIVTGILLAIARVSGETAPLLFTALGNQFWNTDLTQPIAALPLQIFVYAISPFEDWQAQAWAGALVLIGMIFFLNLSARVLFKNRMAKGNR